MDVIVPLVWVYYKGQFLCFVRGQFLGVIKKWLFKPLSYACIFKTTYMYLLIANRFVESILTCVPIRSFFHGLAAKAASPVL